MEPTERYLKLLGETAQVRWSGLAPLHLRGALLRIVPDLDLIRVAEAISSDDAQQVAAWASAGSLERMPAEAADAYAADDRLLWAVVVAPWVVVQDRGDSTTGGVSAAGDVADDDSHSDVGAAAAAPAGDAVVHSTPATGNDLPPA